MKKTLKGYISGFITAAILVGTISFAAPTATTLNNVMSGGIKVVVNGKKINPTDANGKTVEPIIYNGTTYLPVRAIADALHMAVSWDGPNFTAYLGDCDGKLKDPTVELEKMTSIGDKIEKSKNLKDNYDNTYSRAVYNRNCNLEYLLNMKYSRFKGTLYVPKGENSSNSVYLKIIADGKTIYTSPEMTKTSYPVDIDVNVTGYNDVKIQFSERDLNYASFPLLELCIGDAGFYQ